MNLKTAVGEWRIRHSAEREDIALKATASRRVNCEGVGFRYRVLRVTDLQPTDSTKRGSACPHS